MIARAVLWGELELWHGVAEQIGSQFCQHVVYENIVPRSLDFNPVGLQVIGVIRYVCEVSHITPTPQPNALLRGIERWGVYDLSHVKSPHARDALMHGIVYLRKRKYSVEQVAQQAPSVL